MRIAAVISEFNPFHNGHRFFIDSVRERLGADTCIIALMSGNYTQRGEIAIADLKKELSKNDIHVRI